MYRYFLFFLLIVPFAQAQTPRFTISGYVQEAESGEKLIGATVIAPKLKAGTVTNKFGYFSLTLPADSVQLVVSFVGYQSKIVRLKLNRDVQMQIELKLDESSEAVEIAADRVESIVETTQMSSIDIPISQIKKIPAIMGETDVIKAIQLLPGVSGGTEGASGLYVRGGSPDQNLILLDGAPVYNVSHLFGFFSVFNSDAIKNVELVKGGYPARYGGRLSSVLDISMKEGNMRDFEAEGAIGLIASRLTVQAPIKKDKASFILSGRRTYIDLLARPIIKATASNNGDEVVVGYYFYDLNGKVNYIVSPKDRIYLSAYLGDDRFYNDVSYQISSQSGTNLYERNKGGLEWGNLTSTLRWNHVFSPKLFANTMLTYSNYQFDINLAFSSDEWVNNKVRTDTQKAKYFSGIKDQSAKIDFEYLPNPQHTIRFGTSAIHHTYKPGAAAFRFTNANGVATDSTITPKTALTSANEFAVYAEDDWAVSPIFKVNGGLHFSAFNVSGKTFTSLQPRLAARLKLGDVAVKASYATMQQYIHLLTNSGIGLPTDLWLPATPKAPPQQSWQAAAGLAYSFGKENGFEVSIEGYYKDMKNVLEYKEGSSFFNDPASDWQNKVEVGNGKSYGLELFFQRKVGKTTGWIGYTLAKTTRQFPNLNQGKEFPFRYDARHDFEMTMNHEFSKRFDFSATWVYNTGNALTIAQSRYVAPLFPWDLNFGSHTNYGSRNDFRMPNYHRLDLAANFHRGNKSRIFGKGEKTWTVAAYNAYNRANPFMIQLATERTYNFDPNTGKGVEEAKSVFKQISLFPIIPSVSYSFKF